MSRYAPLRNRDFRLLLFGQATSTLGSSFTSIALAFAVLQTTGSVGAVGLVLGATRLPLLLFVLLGGVVGDRLSRRRVMLASDFARFATQATAAALLLTHEARLWHLLLLFAASGTAQAFFNPAAVGLLPELVDTGNLQPANALMDFARNGCALIGQLAGGAFVAALGAGAALGLDSATFLISASTLAALNIRGAVKTRATKSLLRDLAEGWDEFRSRTWLWAGTLHIALLNAFALAGFFALGPVVAQRSLGGAAAWGLIGAAFAAGMIAGSALAVRWRPRRPLVVAFGVIVFAAPQLFLLALAAPAVAVAFASFFGGAQASVWGALWTTTMQRNVPEQALARAASYGSVGGLILAPIGLAGVGYVAQAVGTDVVLSVGAGWILISTLVVVALPCMRCVESADPQATPSLVAA